MIQRPSLQNQYDLFWTGDDAIVQLPADATKEQREEHVRRLRVARETGDWSGALVEGGTPTRFRMRQVAGHVFRRLVDRMNSGALGEVEMQALLFRLAIVDVVNLDGPDGKPLEIELAGTAEYGQLATTALVDYLDSITPAIVSQLGAVIFERTLRSGKS